MILVIFLTVWKVFQAESIKVTIVGDSITCCTPDGDHAYPKILQSLVGDVYEISSFGVGGTTAMTSDHIDPEWQSYTDTKEYQAALESKWEYLVIMLGTNDGHPRNFPAGKSAIFEADYRNLVQSFVKVNPQSTIFICTTPYSHEPDLQDSYRESVETEYIRPIQINTAAEFGLKLIDIGYVTKNDPGFLGPDGLHPTLEGADRLARAVLRAFTER